jgi:hypothetical protein
MHHIARRFVLALVPFDVNELPEGMVHLKSFADKAFNSATRLAAVGVSALSFWPALIGMRRSMSRRTAAGSAIPIELGPKQRAQVSVTLRLNRTRP